MLCEQCKSREANVLIKEIVGGVVTEHNLCSQCAKDSEIGGIFEEGNPFARFLSGLMNLAAGREPDEEDGAEQMTCPGCGMQYSEFVQNGRFGCGDCYETFGPLMYQNIKNIQGGSSHSGKKPRFFGDMRIHADMVANAKKEQGIKEQLEICLEKQREAVREENYEQAAFYRDEIKRLKALEQSRA